MRCSPFFFAMAMAVVVVMIVVAVVAVWCRVMVVSCDRSCGVVSYRVVWYGGMRSDVTRSNGKGWM